MKRHALPAADPQGSAGGAGPTRSAGSNRGPAARDSADDPPRGRPGRQPYTSGPRRTGRRRGRIRDRNPWHRGRCTAPPPATPTRPGTWSPACRGEVRGVVFPCRTRNPWHRQGLRPVDGRPVRSAGRLVVGRVVKGTPGAPPRLRRGVMSIPLLDFFTTPGSRWLGTGLHGKPCSLCSRSPSRISRHTHQAEAGICRRPAGGTAGAAFTAGDAATRDSGTRALSG